MNFSEAFDAVSRICFDKSYRLRREKNIREHFVPRTWNDVGRDIQTKLLAISPGTSSNVPEVDVRAAYARPSLAQGTFFKPKALGFGARLRETYCKNPVRLALSDGWYTPELFGCWMQGRYATIEFETDLAPGEEVLVVAQLASAPGSEACRIAMFVGQNDGSVAPAEMAKSTKPLGGSFNMMARGVVDDLSGLVVTFELKGDQPKPIGNDTRSLAAGLVSVGYAKQSSLEWRLSLMEMMLFDT
jgi:hypothetical protein